MIPVRFVASIVVAGAVGLGTVVSGLGDQINPPDRPAGLEAHESHASVSLLGQFRSSISSWLYLRTDLYLHNGVELRPLTDDEKRAGRKGVGSVDKGEDKLCDDESIVTVVPSKERDFRGVFGDIERATTTYKDMTNHKHSDPESTLPLFRLMTWLDPRFIPGWIYGATIVTRDKSERSTRESLTLLHQGLDANPQNIEILKEIGCVLASRRRDLPGALSYLEQARAQGAEHFNELSDGEREALDLSYRWMGFCYKAQGKGQERIRIAREGLSHFHDDGVLVRLATQ